MQDVGKDEQDPRTECQGRAHDQAKDEAYRDALHKFYTKNNDVNEFMTPICYVKISTYEVQAMSYAGIKVANEDGRAKYLSDIRYEIGKFLRMY